MANHWLMLIVAVLLMSVETVRLTRNLGPLLGPVNIEDKALLTKKLHQIRMERLHYCDNLQLQKSGQNLPQIPEQFDAREAWPECWSTVSHIADEGSCDSSWAISTASAISDRLCIQSKAAINVPISALDLSCCKHCFTGTEYCDGGSSSSAWQYFMDEGLVTGGGTGSRIGCKPYDVKDSESCLRACTNERYGQSYSDDLHRGESAYPVPACEHQIQMEIMTNGSVTARMRWPWNFANYGGGWVYRKNVMVYYKGWITVRLIGWGILKGEPYWLGAYSKGTDWGDGGFFKIWRGINEGKLEENVFAGSVKL